MMLTLRQLTEAYTSLSSVRSERLLPTVFETEEQEGNLQLFDGSRLREVLESSQNLLTGRAADGKQASDELHRSGGKFDPDIIDASEERREDIYVYIL